MVTTERSSDGTIEIRLYDEDVQLDAVVNLSRPAYHALLCAYLLEWQKECREIEAAPRGVPSVIPFPSVPARSAPTASQPQRLERPPQNSVPSVPGHKPASRAPLVGRMPSAR